MKMKPIIPAEEIHRILRADIKLCELRDEIAEWALSVKMIWGLHPSNEEGFVVTGDGTPTTIPSYDSFATYMEEANPFIENWNSYETRDKDNIEYVLDVGRLLQSAVAMWKEGSNPSNDILKVIEGFVTSLEKLLIFTSLVTNRTMEIGGAVASAA